MNPSLTPPPEQCLVCLVEVVNRAPKTQTEAAGLQGIVNTIETALAERRVLLTEKAAAETADVKTPAPIEKFPEKKAKG